MKYGAVTNPKWANPQCTALDVMVHFDGLGVVPFTAAPGDLPHSVEIFSRAVAGEFGPIGGYVDRPEPIPESVTPAQAKITLFEAGLLDEVEALVSDHPYRPVSIWWTNAIQFDRDNAYLQALGMEIGLTDEQIDDMFIEAAKK